jgi:hypothetical protein
LRAADSLLGRAQAAFARHDYPAAYALAEAAYYKVAAVASHSAVAPSAKAGSAVSRTHIGTDPHEFIDTLGPHSPRSKP